MRENRWKDPRGNKTKALEQTAYMDENYTNETVDSVINTNIWTGPMNMTDWTDFDIRAVSPKSQLLDLDTVSAILHVKDVIGEDNDVKVAVLNFASYHNPGGKFIEGSNAQEECLCHSSNLYNILKQLEDDYYKENRRNPNRGLYRDRALYTPNVIFHDAKKEHFIKVDVITCAAPNLNAASKWATVTPIENVLVLAQRMQFIKDIAETEKVDVLILGAWGCGVFKQDPTTVAKLFNFIFRTTEHVKNIVYAIPNSLNSNNYKAFDKVLNRK